MFKKAEPVAKIVAIIAKAEVAPLSALAKAGRFSAREADRTQRRAIGRTPSSPDPRPATCSSSSAAAPRSSR